MKFNLTEKTMEIEIHLKPGNAPEWELCAGIINHLTELAAKNTQQGHSPITKVDAPGDGDPGAESAPRVPSAEEVHKQLRRFVDAYGVHEAEQLMKVLGTRCLSMLAVEDRQNLIDLIEERFNAK